MIEELSEIPQKMEKVLEQAPMIKDISRMFTYAHNFLYLGRGVNYPVAMEGALKLKEISYIHAEGYPAAEMKHGPIALVDQDMPIVFLATHHQLYEKIISNMQEVKSRNGRILAVVTEGDQPIALSPEFCNGWGPSFDVLHIFEDELGFKMPFKYSKIEGRDVLV